MTNGGKINAGITNSKQILVAPLDWGLGHVTRCIPIIQQLIAQGHHVILAANGRLECLLRHQFPSLEISVIPYYDLNYSTTKTRTKWKFFFQLPKILTAIKRENQWLAAQMQEKKFDVVISDCRFGLHHPNAFCVFLTHQLHIKSPFGKWTEAFLQKRNYAFINRFNECWVPDFAGDVNLAGELSHPATMPQTPVKYIGGISRLTKNQSAIKYDVAVIISGPEPQRTILENILLKEFSTYSGRAVLVRGLPGEAANISLPGLTIYNHLPSEELSELINSSALIISRSGYTTVMDLMHLRKKSIMIPTPGQTEQEYLGEYLMHKKLCVCIHQDKFVLQKALQQAAAFDYADMEQFQLNQFTTTFLVTEKFSPSTFTK